MPSTSATHRPPARPSRSRSFRRARSSRSRRSQSSERIEKYVASLGLDAYVVGGAVRDELLGVEAKDADFLVPGVDIAGLRALLEPHGRTEELVVAGRPVGVRHYPRDRALRALVPAGIELAPPRREVSTGRGRHDFEIVVDPEAPDRRRPRVAATSRSTRWRAVSPTGAGSIPYGGEEDLKAHRLRAVSPSSFAEDPLRVVRGLRFVSQLDLDPDPDTLAQMRAEAERRPPRLGRADRRRPARRRDGRAVEAAARQASRPRRFGSHATPASSSSCCPSSSRRSGSSRRAATTI